jgi:O-antigen ligase
MEDHPIYLSIYLATSIIIIISLSFSVKLWIKFLLFFVGSFQLFILIFLSRKGVIVALMITLALFCFFMIKKHTQLILFFVLSAGFFSLITIKYSPETIKRFKEVFDAKSYNQIKSYSSTSQRYGIYKCSLEKLNESWLVGYGIGDTQNELISCYKKSSNILVAREYNSHNQFLSVLLHVGVLGFFLFLISLIMNLKLFYLKRDYFAFCLVCMYLLIMLTENILERQNGVILFSFLLNFYSFKNTHLR